MKMKTLKICILKSTIGPKRLKMETLFANPDLSSACAVRSAIRSGNLNVASLMEAQKTKLERGMPLWS